MADVDLPALLSDVLDGLVETPDDDAWRRQAETLGPTELAELFGTVQRLSAWASWAAGHLTCLAVQQAEDEARADDTPPPGTSDDSSSEESEDRMSPAEWLETRVGWARSGAVNDLATRAGMGPTSVWRRLHRATDLAEQLPLFEARHRRGEVDHVKVDDALRWVGRLDDRGRRRMDAVLCGLPDPEPDERRGRPVPVRPFTDDVSHLPPERFEEQLERRVRALLPDGEQKPERPRPSACVQLKNLRDGMARLSIDGDAVVLAMVKATLDALRAEGHHPVESLESWAGHAASGLDMYPGSSFVRPDVVVTIPLDSLLGECSAPGDLQGFGPVPADLVRDLARRATVRCAGVDHEGTLIRLGERTWTPPYRPSRTLRRFVVVANPRCCWPGCGRAAHRAQLDHVVPWPRGSTCTHNLVPLCVHHHNLKTHTGWEPRVEPSTGCVVWRSPTGAVRRVPPGLWESVWPPPPDPAGDGPDEDPGPPPY